MNMDVYVILKALVEAQTVCLDKVHGVFDILFADYDDKGGYDFMNEMGEIEKLTDKMVECRKMLDQVNSK